MSNQKRTLTPAAIKYLLAISELCSGGRGARSVDVATRLNVSKPSTHHMIQALCEAGYAERERYGAIYLTDAGRSAAAAYGACCERLCAAGIGAWPREGRLPERGLCRSGAASRRAAGAGKGVKVKNCRAEEGKALLRAAFLQGGSFLSRNCVL